MQQERVNTRRRVREKSRMNRLSDESGHVVDESGLILSSRPREQFLQTGTGQKIAPDTISEIVPVLRTIPEFSGCRTEDLEKLTERMEMCSFPGDQIMLRQVDNSFCL